MNKLNHGSYLGLFIFGFIFNIVGPSLSFLIEDFQLTLTEAGSIYFLRGLGFILSVLIGGLISDLIGRKAVILFGAGLWIIGLFIFSIAQSAFIALGIWLILGIGFGTIDSGLNALVADINEDKGSALSKLHFWFSIGALTGPILAGIVLTYFNWRLLFVIANILAIYFFIVMYRVKYPELNSEISGPLRNIKNVFTLPIILVGIIAFGYTGVGTAFMGWINVYLINHFTATTLVASFVLAIYSVGLAIGRLVSSFITEQVGYEKMLILSTVFSFITALVAVFSNNIILTTIGFGLTGFFFASLLPTSLAIGTKKYPNLIGTVTGVVITFGSFGRTILPGAVGAIADYATIALGLRLLLVVNFCMIISAIIICKNKINSQKIGE